MALRLNPIPTQTFSLPQMASLRSPRFRMASTLRSGSKLVPLSDPPLINTFSSFFKQKSRIHNFSIRFSTPLTTLIYPFAILLLLLLFLFFFL